MREYPVVGSHPVDRSVVAARGRTSLRLEPELLDAPLEICQRDDLDASELVRQIEAKGHIGGRTSAVRVYVLTYYRIAATEHGHLAVGHGLHTRHAA